MVFQVNSNLVAKQVKIRRALPSFGQNGGVAEPAPGAVPGVRFPGKPVDFPDT
ncbi:MAG: hypothetical protein ACLQU1_29315 [Bryobacteraceae bacterium]